MILLDFAEIGGLSGYDKYFVDQSSSSNRIIIAAVLATITVEAAILRFHALAAKTFWFDEGVSVAIARLDAYNFVRILWRREANMSLYYLLLHAWLWMGHSEAFIRSLSVSFAIATIPAIYALGRVLFDSRTGLIAAALLSVNAFHVSYSQEARSYSLMVLLCTLSSLYFAKTIKSPSRRNRVAYIVFSVLAVYAHFYSLLLVVAQYLSLRYLPANAPRPVCKPAWKIIGLSVSPILLFVLTTGAGPLKWIPRPGLKDLWNFAVLLAGHGGTTLLLLAFSLAILGAHSLIRNNNSRWAARFLLAWIFFPIISVLVLSLFRPLFFPRYFLFTQPAILLLVATGLARVRPPWLRLPTLTICLVLSLYATFTYYHQDFDNERDDWRSATDFVLTQSQVGDALLFHVPMGRMPYEYYHSLRVRKNPAPVVLYPSHGDKITFLDFVEKPDMAGITSSLPSYQRVWVIIAHADTPNGFDSKATALLALAHDGHANMGHTTFNGIDIFLCQ